MRRISFLPAFFTVLTIAFVVVAAVRIRSYSAGGAGTAPQTTSRINAAQPSPSVAQPSIGDASVAATETIENIGSNATESAADQRRIAEREQRYNELLKAAPQTGGTPAPAATPNPSAAAPHAVVQPAPKAPLAPPSLLSRIGNAITRAVNGATGGSMTSASSPGHGESASNSDRPKDRDKDPKDPNSDTSPPTLASVVFDPPSVHDGEETTLFITANDDISGVRTISGNVVSPSGALQGFALQREAETNRFVTRIMIPKDAAEGLWHVNYLNLTDNASNSVTLSYAQGMMPATASFRVQSSRSDTTPPQLKQVWLDRNQMKAGEKDTIYVQADDDKSGVNLVSGVFISPSKFARIGFGCRQQGDSNQWNCEIMPPSNVDCGDWQLEQIQLQDKANNMAAIRSDNAMIANVKLNVISDGCDSKPPVVQQVVLDQVRVSAPSTINVTVQATDDSSGVSSVSGHFVFTGSMPQGGQPPRLYFSCRPTGEAPVTTWTGPLPVPDKAAKGVWRLGALQVLDKANNLKLYGQNEPVVANVQFTVQ